MASGANATAVPSLVVAESAFTTGAWFPPATVTASVKLEPPRLARTRPTKVPVEGTTKLSSLGCSDVRLAAISDPSARRAVRYRLAEELTQPSLIDTVDPAGAVNVCETARVVEIDTAPVNVVLLVPADAEIAPTASTPRMASATARMTQT